MGARSLVVQDAHETVDFLGTGLRTLEPILGNVELEHWPLQTHPVFCQGLGLCGQHALSGRTLGMIPDSTIETERIEALVNCLRAAERPNRCLRNALLVVSQIARSLGVAGLRVPAAATATRSAQPSFPGCRSRRTPDRCTPDHYSLSRCVTGLAPRGAAERDHEVQRRHGAMSVVAIRQGHGRRTRPRGR